MATARVFRSGNSQAVRLPKQFRLKSDEVEIFRRGEEIVLREKKGGLARAFEILSNLSEDVFKDERKDAPPQTREGLCMQPRYLLDTNICIYIRRHRPP